MPSAKRSHQKRAARGKSKSSTASGGSTTRTVAVAQGKTAGKRSKTRSPTVASHAAAQVHAQAGAPTRAVQHAATGRAIASSRQAQNRSRARAGGVVPARRSRSQSSAGPTPLRGPQGQSPLPSAAGSANAALVKQLQRSVADCTRKVALWEAIVATIRQNKRMPVIVPDTTQWDPHDKALVEWYRTKITKPTNADLDRANADLRDANTNLRDAKRDLDRATQAQLAAAAVAPGTARLPQCNEQRLPPQIPTNAELHPIVTAVTRGPNDGPWVVYSDERDLYIRTDHYPPLYDLHVMPCLAAAHRSWAAKRSRVSANFLVMGSPGIGKSMGMNFMLMRSLRQFPEILVITMCVDEVDFFVPDGQNSHKRYTVLRSHLKEDYTFLNFVTSLPGVTAAPKYALSRPPLLVLHDIKHDKQQAAAPLPYQIHIIHILDGHFAVVLAVFSSPNESNYAVVLKEPASHSETYWMPLWSEDEMECLKKQPGSPANRPDSEFDAYWEQAGGMLRCWTWSLSKIKDERKKSLEKFTAVHYLRCVPDASDHAPSLVVAPTCTHDHQRAPVQFVSKAAEEDSLKILKKVGCHELYLRAKDDVGDVRGRYFERLATRLLELMIEGKIRKKLEKAKALPPNTKGAITIDTTAASVCQFTSQRLASMPLPQAGAVSVGFPRNPNFPFIDQVILQRDKADKLTAVLFQCTARRRHPATARQVATAWSELRRMGVTDPPSFVWVTPGFGTRFEVKRALASDASPAEQLEFDKWDQFSWHIEEKDCRKL